MAYQTLFSSLDFFEYIRSMTEIMKFFTVKFSPFVILILNAIQILIDHEYKCLI